MYDYGHQMNHRERERQRGVEISESETLLRQKIKQRVSFNSHSLRFVLISFLNIIEIGYKPSCSPGFESQVQHLRFGFFNLNKL